MLLLSTCSVRPDIWCPDEGYDLRPTPEVTLNERITGVFKDCALMLRVTLDSYTGEQ